MQLTSYTDYALRVLIYLGLKGDKLSSVTEIAGQYGISRNHLVKVVHRLAREGFVHSQRGRNGGLRLRKPAHLLNVGEVVRCMEETRPLVECFSPSTNQCPIAPACRLTRILAEARENFFLTLDRYTVADLIVTQQSLVRLLLPSPSPSVLSSAPPPAPPPRPLRRQPMRRHTAPAA